MALKCHESPLTVKRGLKVSRLRDSRVTTMLPVMIVTVWQPLEMLVFVSSMLPKKKAPKRGQVLDLPGVIATLPLGIDHRYFWAVFGGFAGARGLHVTSM
jgi:hypothetical protein